MYKTKKWLRKRKHILKRDKYLCQYCLKFGKTTDAQMVHHIIPAREEPTLFLNNDNLISLCNSCHELMHDRKNEQLTEIGRTLIKRKAIKTTPPTKNG